NRAEIVRELSWGRVTRRDLLKWGLFSAAGALAPKGGLSPFVSMSGQVFGPTGAPPSPLFGCQPFSQPMPRFDVLPRQPIACANPFPTAMANQTQMPVDPLLGGGTGPIEGRPPGAVWAHQRFDEHAPAVYVTATQRGATTNYQYDPGVPGSLNSGMGYGTTLPCKFHPGMPVQSANSVWTFNGTIPPKLVQARYAEPLIFRHYNGLPADVTQNGGFGRHTISTHEHNGHHGAENDGFTGAYFFPGQFYDYHWPVVLAGHYSFNSQASDIMASTPDGSGGLIKVPGDWHETMSTHWFHDHMFSFTAQNVYKGNAAMFNIYSGLDRGNESITDGVNLKLPSGSTKDWGNLDYDVNLMIADKCFDSDGQLFFDIFQFNGFLGDVMTVNLAYKPYMEVERRKYRFRILNAAVSRFFKFGLANAAGFSQPMTQIANDGNLLPRPVTLFETDEMGIAERYDIVIDFSQFQVGEKLHLVNLADHSNVAQGVLDGQKPVTDLTMPQALFGNSADPCVGRFLEFRVVRDPAVPDQSQVPDVLIPNPDLSQIPVVNERTFVFGKDGIQAPVGIEPSTAGPNHWGIGTNGGIQLTADYDRVSAAPRFGTREIWHLVNDGGGWDHPIHIHFEEGQILARDGSFNNVSNAERGRKDVYRLHPKGSVTITMQFRDWGGMYMEHCHNTMHEDNAMLLRWEINDAGGAFLQPLPTPIPTPQGVRFEDPFLL
ncbi:MAG TPA: multicopper oxidase domain-containing protein, partial [Vicinamibacterales bacterium]|nr:multicopper oxidase domain-containing protein [Vicinamibacterales bacterium]